MDRAYVEQHDIVERYRLGQLTPSEMADFEAMLLDDPAILDELELDFLMAEGMRSTRDAVDRPVKRPSWQLPMAASVLVALGASLLLNLHLISRPETTEPTADVEVLALAPLLSGTKDFRASGTVSVRPNTRYVLFRVSLPFDWLTELAGSEPKFDVEVIKHPAKERVVVISDVEPRGAGDLIVSVPASALSAGGYWVVAEHESGRRLEIPFVVQQVD